MTEQHERTLERSRALCALGVALALLSVAGCTYMEVGPVPAAPAGGEDIGLRYCLPKPMIVVLPNGDGSLTAQVAYLPDEEHAYGIKTWSRLGTHNVDIEVAGGLLKKVAWGADSEAVAAQAVVATGAVTKSALAAYAQAQATKQTNINTAADSLATAEGNLAVARAKLETLQEPGLGATSAEIKNQRILVTENEVKVETAQKALATVKRRKVLLSPAAVSVPAMAPSAPTVTAGAAPALPAPLGGLISAGPYERKVHGGMLLAIDERQETTGDKLRTVVLRPVKVVNSSQPGQPNPPEQPAYDTKAFSLRPLSLSPKGEQTVAPGTNGAMVLTYTLSRDCHDITDVELKKLDANHKPQPVKKPAVSLTSATSLTVNLAGYDPGRYRLWLVLKHVMDDATLKDERKEARFRILTAAPAPRLAPKGFRSAVADDSGRTTLSYTISGVVPTITTEEVECRHLVPQPDGTHKPGNSAPKPPVSIDKDKKLTVELTGVDRGAYQLTIPFVYKDGAGRVHDKEPWVLTYTTAPNAPLGQPTVLPRGIQAVTKDKDGNATVTYTTSGPVTDIIDTADDAPKCTRGEETVDCPPISLASATSVEVQLRKPEAGAYTLTIPFTYLQAGESRRGTWTVRYKVP